MKSISHKIYGAIRRSDEGQEFIDIETLSSCKEVSIEKSKKVDKEIPAWVAANKIVRISELRIIEI